MNVPPTDGIQVPSEDLRVLVFNIYRSVPIPEEDARLVADLLVDTELRGVVSHGVTQVERYVRSYQEGKMNPRPEVQVLNEGPVTAALSGDGGLGMIVAARARELGVGIVTTTYHDHVGSSGKYVRMALREDLIGIGLSGRSAAPSRAHDSTIHGSIQGSPPLAFGFPAGAGRPCFLLDLASHTPWDEQCFRKMPQVFVKAIGMSHVANILSGTLGGQMLPEFDRGQTQFRGADHRGSTRLSTWSGSRLWRPLRRIWTSSWRRRVICSLYRDSPRRPSRVVEHGRRSRTTSARAFPSRLMR